MIKPYFLWKIKFNLKKREKTDDIVSNLREARSILVICVNKTSDVMSFISDMREFLPKAKISTWIFNKLNDDMKTRNSGVKESEIRKVRTKKYDLVIDLTGYEEIPWLYFVSNFQTKVNVGIIQSDKQGIFNLLVNPSDKTKIDYNFLIEYLRRLVST